MEDPLLSILEDRKYDKCSYNSAEYLVQMLNGSKISHLQIENIRLSKYILKQIKRENNITKDKFRNALDYVLACHWNYSHLENKNIDIFEYFYLKTVFVYVYQEINDILKEDYCNQITHLDILEECFCKNKLSEQPEDENLWHIQKFIRHLNIHFEKRYALTPILINVWYDLIKSWFRRLRYQLLSTEKKINMDINQKNILIYLHFIEKSKNLSSVEIDHFWKKPLMNSINYKVAQLHEIFNSFYWREDGDKSDYQRKYQYYIQNRLIFQQLFHICEELQELRLNEEYDNLGHEYSKSIMENIIGDIFFFNAEMVNKEYSLLNNDDKKEYILMQISAALNMV